LFESLSGPFSSQVKTALHLDTDGWLTNGCCRPSPHFNERPRGETVSLIVIHYISLPPGIFEGEDVDALFLGKLDCRQREDYAALEGLRVSSHFVIRRSGAIRQYVSTEKRAWHAGVSVFEGRSGCNDFSVGIEMEGTGEVDFDERQYEALGDLLAALCVRYPIEAVTGHEVIAPGRKKDPGPHFDWERLRSMLPDSVRVVSNVSASRSTEA